MKRFYAFIIALMVVSMSSCTMPGNTIKTTVEKKPSMVLTWETPEGLLVPESVLYDKKNQVLYVSNINGKPTLKNNQGYIARVNLDGSIKTRLWVTGLNAPKGMGIKGDTLYVTDIDRVVAIDIPTGSIRKIWEVDNAKFLNDIAIDDTGRVFITDMATRTIHVIQDGQILPFLVVDNNRPNGLFMKENTLVVGTAEGVLKIDTPSRTMALDIAHQGGIDGIKALGENRYLVSDWKGKVQMIQKGQAPVVLIDTSAQKVNAADFEYIPEKNLVIIPTFFNNRIVAYQLRQ